MNRGPHIFRKLRASRAACALLLAFQCFFLNVVLPGHTRGAITLSGKSLVCSMGDLGCPFCGHSDPAKKSPTRQDQSDCAICHLAMRIATEAPVDFHITDLGLLYIAPPSEIQTPVLAAIVSLPLCRGPPVSLFA
jgi:hypothetical protein